VRSRKPEGGKVDGSPRLSSLDTVSAMTEGLELKTKLKQA
jgi:hypothetical protein